jgi:putative redox protein
VIVQTDQNEKADQAEKLGSLVLKNCGMIQSVIGSIDVRYQIDFTPDQPKKGDVS